MNSLITRPHPLQGKRVWGHLKHFSWSCAPSRDPVQAMAHDPNIKPMQINTWLLSLRNQDLVPMSPDPFLTCVVGGWEWYYIMNSRGGVGLAGQTMLTQKYERFSTCISLTCTVCNLYSLLSVVDWIQGHLALWDWRTEGKVPSQGGHWGACCSILPHGAQQWLRC